MIVVTRLRSCVLYITENNNLVLCICVPASPETSNRSRSSEKLKSETGREKAKRKRQTFDGTDLASIANSLEKPPPEEMALIRSEPVSTQTEYTHRKVEHKIHCSLCLVVLSFRSSGFPPSVCQDIGHCILSN